MDTLVQLGSSYSILSPPLTNVRTTLSSSKGHSSFFSNTLRTTRSRRPLMKMVVEAKRGKKGKQDKNDYNSSFRIRPDESTGPFPEALLLKKKVVQEDGKALPEFADEDEAKLYQELNIRLESQMNVEKKRHYEVVYMIHENHVDKAEEVNTIVKAFMEEKKAKIWRFLEWGLRRLAYPIKKTNYAYYILMNFEMPTKWVNDFNNLLKDDERVLRHLVMKRDRAETEILPPPPEYQTLLAQWRGEYGDVEDSEDDEDSEDYEDDEEDYEDDEDEEGYEDEEEELDYEDGEDEEEDEDEEGYEDEEEELVNEDEEDVDVEGDEDEEEESGNEDEEEEVIEENEDTEGYEDEKELSDEDEQDIEGYVDDEEDLEDYEDDEDEESYDEDDEEISNDEHDEEVEIEKVSRREVKQKEDQKTVTKDKRKNIFKLAKSLR